MQETMNKRRGSALLLSLGAMIIISLGSAAFSRSILQAKKITNASTGRTGSIIGNAGFYRQMIQAELCTRSEYIGRNKQVGKNYTRAYHYQYVPGGVGVLLGEVANPTGIFKGSDLQECNYPDYQNCEGYGATTGVIKTYQIDGQIIQPGSAVTITPRPDSPRRIRLHTETWRMDKGVLKKNSQIDIYGELKNGTNELVACYAYNSSRSTCIDLGGVYSPETSPKCALPAGL